MKLISIFEKLKSEHYRFLAFSAFWAIPLLILIRLIRPICHIYFLELRSDRIGHFIPDGAELVHRFKSGENFENTFVYFSHRPVNTQWARMLARTIPIKQWVMPLAYFNKIIKGGGVHSKYATLHRSRDVNGWLHKSKNAQIAFTKEETEICSSFLSNVGLAPTDEFVTLIVRDSSYLENFEYKGSTDFNYHSYRNADIETFKSAIEYLTKNNLSVFCMGKSNKRLNDLSNPRVIHFNDSANANDLIEVWLFANCKFCISTGTGPDTLPSVYRRPTIFLNFLPILYLHDYHHTLTVPKNLKWKDTNLPLSLNEHLEHDYLHTEQYYENNIEIVDLSSEEITEAIIEFHTRLKGTHKEKQHFIDLQNLFWQEFTASPKYLLHHNWKHTNSRIGENWLDRNAKYFLDK